MRKIFILTATLFLSQFIIAQNITSITAPALQCSGDLVDISVTTDAIPAQLPFNYNLYFFAGGQWNPYPGFPVQSSTANFTISGVGASNYQVEILAGGVPVSTDQINIIGINPFTYSFVPTTVNNVSCNGLDDGSITLFLTNGTPPYTYSWTGSNGYNNPNETNATISGLEPGTYTCVPTDANGCAFEGNPPVIVQQITEPSILNVSNTTTSAVQCYGENTGTATVLPSGGTGPYTYSWSDGQTSQTAVNLFAGDYTCTVTDANGCIAVTSIITVTEPLVDLSLSVTLNDYNGVNVTCLGASDGIANVTASGGTASYTFSWANSSGVSIGVGPTLSGLASGTYTCTVTDANGCQKTTTFTVIEPTTLPAPNSVVISNWNGEDISCNGGSNGSAEASAIGGTPSTSGSPYTYLWDNGSINSVATGLSAGSYDCIVTDANGCSATTTVTLTEPTPITILSTPTTSVSCNGGNDGTATVNPNGGTPPYSFQWNDFAAQVTQTATGLFADIYDCDVTDNNGCTYNLNPVQVQVNEPGVLTATITNINNVSCTGGNDGSATISISGGTAPYTYLWSNGQTTPTATGLSETTSSGIPYTCQVTDANGCALQFPSTGSVNVYISEPASLPTVVTTHDMPSCQGDADGVVNVVASGGTAPYTYIWRDNTNAAIGTTPTVTGLVAGTYTIEVTDANGCVVSSSETVFEPNSQLVATQTISQVSCHGGSDGAATVFPTGGIPPYTFTWSGPDPSVSTNTTSSISGVIVGTYVCDITDDNGCVLQVQIDLVSPPLLEITDITSVDPSCVGYSDGSLTANVIGGTGAGTYIYQWSDGQTTPTAGALSAGTYTCVVTDANGCSPSSASLSATIIDPPVINVSANPIPVACTGEATGSITLNVNGGTPNTSGSEYTYLWSNGTTTQDNVLLPAGTYSCSVWDANGCLATTGPITVGEPATALSATPQVLNDETCSGFNDGSATVIVFGGTLNYSYNWSNAATSQIATNLSAGSYTCTVTDANGCTEDVNLTINAASPISVNMTSLSPSCNSTTIGIANDGTASANVIGGLPPYTYQWDDANNQTTQTAIGLIAGTYNCAILDANGCQAPNGAGQIIVSEPSPDITANPTINNVSCYGLADGSIVINAIGGTPPLTYDWPSLGSSAPIVQNLVAGTYLCNVSDATGCITQFFETVTEPAELTVTAIVNQISTTNANDGSISVTPNGGTGGYNYLWSGPNGTVPNTTSSINMLSPGLYTVTITDAVGCQLTYSANIINPACQVLISDNIETLSCNGDSALVWWSNSNGLQPYTNILVDPSGDTISNSWVTDQFQSNQNAVPALYLTAGNYPLTVIDAGGCIAFMNINVVEPPSLDITLTTTDALCHSELSGTATATVVGGTPPYSIDWEEQNTGLAVNPNGLQAGTYIVSVSDANNCIDTAIFTISEPSSSLSVGSTSTLVGCMPTNNGTATILASGGTAPYNYLWGSGEVTATISNLIPGLYTCAVTDANGCTDPVSSSITVQVNSAPALDILITPNPPTCNNGNDGSITTSVNTGTLPISYNWQDVTNPGILISNASSITGLSDGTYSFLAVDAFGCADANTSITITSPSSLNFILNPFHPSLNGASDGSINTTNVSGGTPPYTFQWIGSGGFTATTQDVSNLPSGTYTLIVTDANGCATPQTVNIIDPACAVISTLNLTQPACNGGVGNLSWQNSGGQAPYLTEVINTTTMMAYVVSSANPSSTVLPPGDYYLSTTDDYGCISAAYNFSVIDPLPLTSTYTTTQTSCATGQGPNGNGTLVVTASGGTPPYIYTYADLSGNPINISALSAGNYVYTVVDANGCQLNPSTPVSFSITEPTPISIFSPIVTTDVTCFNFNDGTAAASITGGTPNATGDPYNYTWSPSGETTNPAQGLDAGIETLLVTDANGCSETETAIIGEPLDITISFSNVFDVSCYGYNDGSITANPFGGNPPYTYLWDNGQTTQTATSLGPGTYTVTVTDASGICTASSAATITEPNEINVNLTVTDVTCNGFNDGTASIAPTGCNSCNIQWWDPSFNTQTVINGLFPSGTGTYWVIVTDPTSPGCFGDSIFVINEPDVLSATATSDSTTCYNVSDGSVSVVALGGTPPYTYQWTDANGTIVGTTATVNGLPAGTYDCQITDNSGTCAPITTSTIVLETAPIEANLVIYDVSCNSGNDGYATIDPVGENDDFTYFWSTTGSTDTVSTALVAGAYTVVITPTNGCPDSAITFNVNEPASLSFAHTYTDASCFGLADGQIDLNVSGGTAPYTYLWSDGQVTDIASGLVAGTYTCQVTDANGCTDNTTNIVITEPDVMWVNLDINNVSCNGVNDGWAQVNPIGVTGSNFQVSWNSTTPTNTVFIPLVPGTYSVEIINTLTSCTVDTVFNITQPTTLTASTILTTPALCFGSADGSAQVSGLGGTSPYTYQWEDANGGIVGTTDSVTGLLAGTYSIDVTDALGCTTSISSLIISEPNEILPGFNITPVSCNGLSDGSASVNPSGGTPYTTGDPYDYDWSVTGSTNSVSSGYSVSAVPNLYTVTITDAVGCSEVFEVNITEPAELSVIPSQVSASCFGLSDGTATMTVTGGTSPYNYLWTTGDISQTVSGLSSGTYVCQITDNNGCFSQDTITVNEPSEIIVDTTVQDVSCNGLSDGYIIINSMTGGTAPYSVVWSNTTSFLNINDGLAAGTNGTLQVTDNNGCQASTISFVINEPAPLVANLTAIDPICFGDANGSVTATVTGGTMPYSYEWMDASGSIVGTTATVSGLVAGVYDCKVIDNNNCSTTVSVSVIDPALLQANLVATDASCVGSNDGILTVSPTGSTGPYTVTWSTGVTATVLAGNSNSITGLDINSVYAVSVQDAIGCPIVHLSNLTISEPLPITLTISIDDASCYSYSDGQATITNISGGIAPYTYDWPLGAGGLISPLLPLGNYNVVTTDANGCTSVTPFNISQPDSINPDISITSVNNGYNISCNGGSNGSLDASNPSGGNSGYSWSWTGLNGAFSSSASVLANLQAGTYQLVVTDIEGCTGVQYVTLTEPPALAINFTTSNYNGYEISCNGFSDGWIDANVTGGVVSGNYTYNWSPVTSNDTMIDLLSAGGYNLQVIDDNNCSLIETVNLLEPAAISAVSTTSTTTCNSSNDGILTVYPSGGAGGYTYQWNDPNLQTTDVASGLSGSVSGTNYFCQVSDVNGCPSVIVQGTVFSPQPIVTIFANQNDVTCFSGTDGSLSGISSTGGGGVGYTYSLDGVVYNPPQSIYDNLSAGWFSFYTRDLNGCIEKDSIEISQPAEIIPNLLPITDANCLGVDDGVVEYNPSGGTPFIGNEYIFHWSASNNSQTNTNAIYNNLAGGTYSIIVEDANGCLAFDTVHVGYLWDPIADLTATNVFCSGDSTGTATAVLLASGAANTSPLPNYLWTDVNGTTVGTTSIATGLPAGTYTCVIADNIGCTDTASIVVIEPSSNLTMTVSVTDLKCYNSLNGSASVLPQGGDGGYTYMWHDSTGVQVSTAISVSSLSAGQYSVTVTDISNCSQTDTFTVNQPDTLYSVLNSIDVSCFGFSDATISTNIFGGTPQYTYQWNGPNGYTNTASNLINLDVGNYNLTVTDANGCTSVNQISIIQPDLLDVVTSVVNPACYGYNDGSITLTVTGGVSPYTVIYGNNPISSYPNDSTIIFGNLVADNAPSLTLTDQNGCIVNIAAPAIIQPNLLEITSLLVNNPLCYGDSGSVSIAAIGGTLPYSYDIYDVNNNVINSTSSYNVLIGGDYACILTDGNGCITSDNFTLVEPAEIIIDSLNGNNVACYGENTGSLSVDILNAVGAYSIIWQPSGFSSESISGLSAGEHTIHVYDVNSCYQTTSYMIDENDEIILSISTVDATCSNTSDGSIQVSISGGVQPFDVSLDNQLVETAINDNTNIGSLAAAIYTLEVSDDMNCIEAASVEVDVLGSSSCITEAIIITPDGSAGINDYWSPGLDLSSDHIEVTIMNRWGQEVWNCTSFNGSNECRWSGENNDGNDLPSTDYYYIIEYKNGKPAQTGVITLIR